MYVTLFYYCQSRKFSLKAFRIKDKNIISDCTDSLLISTVQVSDIFIAISALCSQYSYKMYKI